MEMNNAQQQVNQKGDLNQNIVPFNPLSNQRGNFLLIVGIAILLFVIGVGGYILYQKQNTSNNQTKVETDKQILDSKTSPDGEFTVSEEILADYNKIKITDKNGRVIIEDLVAGNEKEIGYNIKFKCQCGTSFKEWVDNSHFKIKIVNGGGEEYEFLVNAATGKVDESSFKKISESNNTANWKTHTNVEGNYSFQYPSDWVVEIFKEKYPYNAKYDKAHVVFQSRATTAKEKADDAPGLPADMATGSVKIITTESMRGTEYSKISEQDFFNPNNNFWLKGNAGGGGPGTTYSNPEEVKIAGKRAIKQESHPTTAYEWVGPNQITTDYYIWLGNSANELIQITFTYDNKNPNIDVLIKDFNQMLSTFKFQ